LSVAGSNTTVYRFLIHHDTKLVIVKIAPGILGDCATALITINANHVPYYFGLLEVLDKVSEQDGL